MNFWISLSAGMTKDKGLNLIWVSYALAEAGVSTIFFQVRIFLLLIVLLFVLFLG